MTYLFECAGWRGPLVEAIPELARVCRVRRPASRVVNAALVGSGSGRETTLSVVEDEPMLSHVELTPAHRARSHREGDISLRNVVVPARTLDDLLADHDGGVDFVVLDVEGGELSALRGFDVDRWRPRALVIEDNSGGHDPTIRHFLERHGYAKVATYVHNDLYLRAADRELIERLDRWWSCSA